MSGKGRGVAKSLFRVELIMDWQGLSIGKGSQDSYRVATG